MPASEKQSVALVSMGASAILAATKPIAGLATGSLGIIPEAIRCELRSDADGPDGQMEWRVSIAALTANGPFSAFPGFDRHIMALDGDGMILDGGPEGPIAVAPAFAPATFSGDWPTSAHLLSNGFSGFNLIVRRSFGRGHMACATIAAAEVFQSQQATCLLYCISGGVTCNGQQITENSAVIVPTAVDFKLEPRAQSARLALCRIWKSGQS